MLLDLDDFTGKYELHTGMYDQAKLLEYIQTATILNRLTSKRYLILFI